MAWLLESQIITKLAHFTLFPILQQVRRREAAEECKEKESIIPITYIFSLLAALMERLQGGVRGYAFSE